MYVHTCMLVCMCFGVIALRYQLIIHMIDKSLKPAYFAARLVRWGKVNERSNLCVVHALRDYLI